MKIAVFSDIHGNFEALKYVTELTGSQKPMELSCRGLFTSVKTE